MLKAFVAFPAKQSNAVGYPLHANLAGWENEPRIYPCVEAEMTFTYAIIADGGIVLAADSQLTHTHSDHFGVIGTYEGCRGKIKRIGGRFAFSIAGNGGLVDTLLASVDAEEAETTPSFDEVVRLYQTSMAHELRRLYPNELPLSIDAAFLFCGYTVRHGRHFPQIIKLDSRSYLAQNPITGRDMAATGAYRHGAAYYLHHRLYRERMPLEQAKLLAYCIAAEVAEQDNSVGGPIEVEVITPEKSEPLRDIEKYERARQQMVAGVRCFLDTFH